MPKNKKKIVPFNLKMLSEVNFLKKKKRFLFQLSIKAEVYAKHFLYCANGLVMDHFVNDKSR